MPKIVSQTLFERWMSIERATGRSLADILRDLNTVAGTNYKHNWPSVVAARNYELERCPIKVRAYMLEKVLPVVLNEMGVAITKNDLQRLVKTLT